MYYGFTTCTYITLFSIFKPNVMLILCRSPPALAHQVTGYGGPCQTPKGMAAVGMADSNLIRFILRPVTI